LAPFALVVLVGLGMLFSTVLFWISLLGLVALLGSYFISLSAGLNFSQLYRVAMAMPALLGSSLKALGWMKRAKTEFIHTKHSSVKP
jgi:hypothetical protein